MPKLKAPDAPNHLPTGQLIHLRLPLQLYHRLRSKSVEPTEYHGMTGVVVRALEAYLALDARQELSFDQVFMRDTRHHMKPSPVERAWSYCGRMHYSLD